AAGSRPLAVQENSEDPMLAPAQVITFLEHEDFTVRRLAVDYLREAHDPAPATADDLWRGYERFPERDRFGLSSGFLYALPFLPATDSSTAWLLDALRARTDEEDEDPHQLRDALAELDFPMLARHREAIFQLAGLPPKIEEHLRARLALADEPPEPLWDRLAEFAKEVDNKHYNEFDERVADRLVEAMARHPEL